MLVVLMLKEMRKYGSCELRGPAVGGGEGGGYTAPHWLRSQPWGIKSDQRTGIGVCGEHEGRGKDILLCSSF